jgi:murein DD-endopeptidase
MEAECAVFTRAKTLILLFALATLVTALSGCGGGRSHRWGPISSCEGSGVINTARSQLGKPYLAGGASPEAGFDCSGFTCWVFSQYGVTLPRRSFDQFNSGIRIPKDQIQAGDLLFFEISQKGASHVGVYTGCGTFVHCPHSGAAVREDRFGDAYWQKRYLGACRVLP